MKALTLRDLDGFQAELEENYRQIAERRQQTYNRTGRIMDPRRLKWLEKYVRDSVRARR